MNKKKSSINWHYSNFAFLFFILILAGCASDTPAPTSYGDFGTPVFSLDDETICLRATKGGTNKTWEKANSKWGKELAEARRRGLDCGVISEGKKVKEDTVDYKNLSDTNICILATKPGALSWESLYSPKYGGYVKEARRRGLNCGITDAKDKASTNNLTNTELCRLIETNNASTKDIKEAKKIGLVCEVSGQIISKNQSIANQQKDIKDKQKLQLSEFLLDMVNRLKLIDEINDRQKSSLLNNLRELGRPALSKLEAKCKSAYEDALDPSICDDLLLEKLD